MKTKIYSGNGINKNCYDLNFPRIITDLLEHFYDTKLYRAEKFPKRIFDLPKEYSISVIKAFADDEGNVDSNRRIGFYSKSKELLDTLVILLREKLYFDSIGDVREKTKGYYYFYLKPKNLEKYYKTIGFNHSKKKEKLKEIVHGMINGRRSGQRGKAKETKERLLKLLNDKILSTYDLMRIIGINKSNINLQVKKLRDQGLIVQEKKIGQTIFWTRRI